MTFPNPHEQETRARRMAQRRSRSGAGRGTRGKSRRFSRNCHRLTWTGLESLDADEGRRRRKRGGGRTNANGPTKRRAPIGRRRRQKTERTTKGNFDRGDKKVADSVADPRVVPDECPISFAKTPSEQWEVHVGTVASQSPIHPSHISTLVSPTKVKKDT